MSYLFFDDDGEFLGSSDLATGNGFGDKNGKLHWLGILYEDFIDTPLHKYTLKNGKIVDGELTGEVIDGGIKPIVNPPPGSDDSMYKN